MRGEGRNTTMLFISKMMAIRTLLSSTVCQSAVNWPQHAEPAVMQSWSVHDNLNGIHWLYWVIDSSCLSPAVCVIIG